MCQDRLTELNDRRKTEDQLLNARTTMVIAVNALAAVAVANIIPFPCKVILGAAIVFINLFWIPRAREARRYIHRLADELKSLPSEEIRLVVIGETRKGIWGRFGSSAYFAVVVPLLMTVAWIAGLLAAIIL